MIEITWSNYGRNKPQRETMAYWFGKLQKHDFNAVHRAFDNWVDSSRELPTVKDIADMLKPKQQDYKYLPKKISESEFQVVQEKLQVIQEKLVKKPARDWVAYWQAILANPSNHKSNITIRFAEQALKNLGAKVSHD